jgi:hypothetical protein
MGVVYGIKGDYASQVPQILFGRFDFTLVIQPESFIVGVPQQVALVIPVLQLV